MIRLSKARHCGRKRPGKEDKRKVRDLWFTATLPVLLFLCLINASLAAAGGSAADRLRVNAMEYPWSAIGRLNAAGRAHCSGTLVGERHVLTAAHCIYDAVTGRWLSPGELHFVAGYQHDRYLIHSPVVAYRHSNKYRPKNEASARNTETDWALLELAHPIGREAGWLGLNLLGKDVYQRLESRRSVLLSAGYRAGAPHAQTVDFNCGLPKRFKTNKGIGHKCFLQKGDSGSPLLLYDRGRFSIVGINVIGFSQNGGAENEIVGALSSERLHPKYAAADVKRAIGSLQFLWNKGHHPQGNGKAAQRPDWTTAMLLQRKGLISVSANEADNQQIRQGLASFYKRSGNKPQYASLQVLGDLILSLK